MNGRLAWMLVCLASIWPGSLEASHADPELLAKLVVPRPAEAAGGADLVALITQDRIVRGRREFSSVSDSQTYFFADEANKNRFDENPFAYLPVLSGFDVVAYKGGGYLVPGSVEHRSIYGSRLYLFSRSEEKKAFDANPAAFEDADLLLQGYSPVSLVDMAAVKPGSRDHTLLYEGRRVRLANHAEQEAYLADPQKFFPSLGGIDPISVADGKPLFGLAQFCALYKGRLYAFVSRENRERFLQNAMPHSDLDVVDGGRDPVALVDDRLVRPGHYAISAVFRGQRYLFSSESNRRTFLHDPVRYDRERRIIRRGAITSGEQGESGRGTNEP